MKKIFKKIINDWKNKDVKVERLGVILKPTSRPFESRAVLNPTCYQEGEFVHVFYRAIGGDNTSSVGYAKLKGPVKIVERRETPLIAPTYNYESKGVEDPRLTKFKETYYLTYVAHDGKNAITAYATSRDLKTWKKRGIISPLVTYDTAASLFEKGNLKDRYLMFKAFYEDVSGNDVLVWFKDSLLFPRKIQGKFAMLIRILPDMQIVFFKNFKELKDREFWKNYLKKLSSQVVLENKYWFESRNIGGGVPPIYTADGWLVIFHTVEELNKARIYHASAALLDKKNPFKVIGRLNRPLFSPEEKWEKEYTSNLECSKNSVVFPTGAAVFGKDLYIYYGAADNRIAAAKVNLKELLNKLKNTPQK